MKYILEKRLLTLLLVALFQILFINFQMILLTAYDSSISYPFFSHIYTFFTHLLIAFLLIRFIVIPVFDFTLNQNSIMINTITIFSASIVYGILYIFLQSVLFNVTIEFSIVNGLKERLIRLLLSDFHDSIKSFLIFYALLYLLDYINKLNLSIQREKRLELELNEFKMAAINSKLRPHFLFNALNTVLALSEENIKKARKSLLALSNLLRVSFNMKPDELIPISEEIKNLKNYIYIEKNRYEEDISIHINILNEESKFQVPAFILQPILENSIKHGFKNKNSLTVQIEIDNKEHTIQIRNNGSSLKSWKEKNGLRIVKQILDYHYKGKAEFLLYQENDWVINQIRGLHQI
jgi:sensor histidine kinase YesM